MPRHETAPQGYASIKDAAHTLDRSRWTVTRLIAGGHLTTIKEGPGPRGRVWIEIQSLHAFIARHRRQVGAA